MKLARPRRSARVQSGAVPAAVVLLVGLLAGGPTAGAKGDDVCPEPNDAFQQACYLGPASDAIGFISRPDDVDAYRFEVRDFGATVHFALDDRPLPYRVSLANYNGEVLASDENGSVEASLQLPGTYYVFVDSPTGAFGDGVPYLLAGQASYASSSVPQVAYSHEFARNSPDAFQETGSRQFSNENGTYTLDPTTNRFTFAMNPAPSPANPTHAEFVLKPDPPEPGPVVEAFTMTIDSRTAEEADAGYRVLFRYDDATGDAYQVTVRLRPRQVTVERLSGSEAIDLTGPRPAPNVSATGVNRTVVRASGKDIRVNVNGQDVVQLQDDSLARGLVGFGAITWGGPITTNFDNILVTVP